MSRKFTSLKWEAKNTYFNYAWYHLHCPVFFLLPIPRATQHQDFGGMHQDVDPALASVPPSIELIQAQQ